MASNMKCKAMILLWTLLILLFMELCWNLVNAKACNRTVRTSVGWIRWTGRMGRCVVRIRAPLKDPQVIELRIRRLQVGTLRDSVCEGAYVQFSDGIEDLENDVGRYCGHVTGNATRLLLRKGPELRIVMDSEVKFAELNPVIFSAQFSVLPARLAYERHGGGGRGKGGGGERSLVPSASDCGLDCKKNNNNRQCRITSPGYPGFYPRGIRCRISLESSVGRFRIGGFDEDVFSLMNYTVQENCRTENCEDINDEPISLNGRTKRYLKSIDYSIDDDDEVIIVGNDDKSRMKKKKKKKTKKEWRKKKKRKLRIKKNHFNNLKLKTEPSNNFGKGLKRMFEQRFVKTIKSSGVYKKNFHCVSDYLSIYENLDDGKLTEIIRLCGDGKIPEIITQGSKIVIEFYSKRDGTIMNDGFHLILNEIESTISKMNYNYQNGGWNFIYKSTEVPSSGIRERIIKSFEHWYPPNTISSYKFIANNGERIFIQLKIIRNNFDETSDENRPDKETENSSSDQKMSLHCPGNEIAVYNGAFSNETLAWSYCDVFNKDINNIQVPITSIGNSLLVQYYSAKGSFNGNDFTYVISYKFFNIFNHHQQQQQQQVRRKSYGNRAGGGSIGRTISLKPVNFSALNITDLTNCNCDFSTRIGSFKSWFIVLVVLGVISFVGAIFTVFSIVTKCLSIRTIRENKLIENPKG